MKTINIEDKKMLLKSDLVPGRYFSPTKYGTIYLYHVKEVLNVLRSQHYFSVLIIKVKPGDIRNSLQWLKAKGEDKKNWAWHHQYSTFKHIQSYPWQTFYKFTTLADILEEL